MEYHRSYSPKHHKHRKWYNPKKFLGKVVAETVNHITHFAPLNATSRAFGRLAASERVPDWVHHYVIKGLVWLYGVPMHEYHPAAVEGYRTTQHFFTREVAHGARPIDATAIVVSPCDAELLQIGEVRDGDMIIDQVHVKGFTFSLETLVQSPMKPMADGMKRVYAVLHLRPGDYHRFRCPMDMQIRSTVHMAGSLLPVTSAAMKWVPRLLVSNERVAIHSEGCVVTAIGATNVGSVRLPWEEEISTNVSRRKSVAHAVQRDYKKGPQLKKGDELGWFEFGSCLVLVMDVPLTARCAVAPFSDVRAGEAMYY